MMNLIRFCIHRPVTTWMAMLLMAMLGVLAVTSMKVELLPDISVPSLLVVAKMAKAGADEIEDKVTVPLEDALNSVPLLKSLASQSEEGVSKIKLEFEWGTDLDLAVMEVKEKLREIDLPSGVDPPYIWRWDPALQPIFRCDIYGAGLDELDRLAKNELKPRLERIHGIGSVTVLGGREREFKVAVSRDALKFHNVTILQVIERLRQENSNATAGKVDVGRYEYLVRVAGKAKDEEELGNVVVGTGQTLLADVAEILPAFQESESYARVNGKPGIGLSISKTAQGNTIEVVDAVRAELARMQKSGVIADKIRMEFSRDDSEYIRQSQKVVISNILQGCLLAVCMVILFIRNIRGAVLLGMSIPFSIIAAFGLLYLWGQTRNILALGGMALAAGMVLDSSVVILENIYRHLEGGMKPDRAAWEGTSEVAMGTLASALTTVLAFMPLLFIPGIIREIFLSLSLSIIAATIFSAVIGLLFMPMIAARIFHAPNPKMGKLERQTMAVLAGFDKLMENALEAVLKRCLSTGIRKVALLAIFTVLAISGILSLPGKDFLPKGKIRELQVEMETPPETALAVLDARVKEVEERLQSFVVELPGKKASVETTTTHVQRGKAAVFVKVRFEGNVEGYTRRDMLEVLGELRKRLQIRGRDLAVRVNMVEKVNPEGATPFKMVIFPIDPEKWPPAQMRRYVDEHILPRLRGIEGSIYFRMARDPEAPELQIRLEKSAVQELGADPVTVSYTVRCFVAGAVATCLDSGNEQVPVRVVGRENERDSADDIAQIPVPGAGRSILLKEIANFTPARCRTSVEHIDKRPAVVVESDQVPYLMSEKTMGDIMSEVDSILAAPDFPENATGFSQAFLYRYQGQSRDLEESSRSALMAFVISVALIYLVLCCQFESWLDPLVIMVTVPLSFPGVALLLHLTREEYSLAAMVGMICLSGVVVNNGIILIEFVNILRRRGHDLEYALVNASKRKLRSILITSLTSILGMLPVLFGIGEGSELYRGCCAVLFGGLLVSTPLTLVGVPVIYALVEDIREFLSLAFLRLGMGWRSQIRGPSG